MSNQQQNVPSIPSPEEAYQTLFNDVHAKAFFNKLAAYGYQPANNAEAQELLDLSGKLRLAEQAKQASVGQTSRFSKAASAVDPILVSYGIANPVKTAQAADLDRQFAEVGAYLAQTPELYNAALSLKAAEAAAQLQSKT